MYAAYKDETQETAGEMPEHLPPKLRRTSENRLI
jgi:hypothetical protein